MNPTERKGGKPGRPKGLPKTGGGSRKGIPNKLTTDLKGMILGALNRAGGEDYLLAQAHAENPTPFLALVGKCLPKDMNVTANVTLTELLREVEARRAKRGT